MPNYVRQFIKIRVVFHTLYIWNEGGDPLFFCISGTSNLLSDCSKNLKKIYRVENFRAHVLKIADEALSRVFDISPQSKQKLRSKWRSKIGKIYAF